MMALADPETLTAVIAHVVQNALDAIVESGRVHVRLLDAGQHIELQVTDNGPGMDAEFIRSQLFRPLHTTKGSGFGIGAYQTRELVREMGGSLEVRSRPGDGTCISVRLKKPEANRNVEQLRLAREG